MSQRIQSTIRTRAPRTDIRRLCEMHLFFIILFICFTAEECCGKGDGHFMGGWGGGAVVGVG